MVLGSSLLQNQHQSKHRCLGKQTDWGSRPTYCKQRERVQGELMGELRDKMNWQIRVQEGPNGQKDNDARRAAREAAQCEEISVDGFMEHDCHVGEETECSRKLFELLPVLRVTRLWALGQPSAPAPAQCPEYLPCYYVLQTMQPFVNSEDGWTTKDY
ncbi:unnamed protein product [Eretmochelys imbricata]